MSQMQDMIPGSPIRTARRKLNLSNEKSRKKSQKRNNKRREKAKANKNPKLSEEKNSLEIGETSENTTSRNEINSELNNTEPSNLSNSKISTNDIENMSASKTIDVEVPNETNERILERNEGSPDFFGFETAGDTKITIPESKLDNALVNNNEISHEIDTENTGNSSGNIEKVSPKKLNKVPINQSVSLSASTLTVTDTNTTLSTESGRYNLRSRKNTPNQKNQNRLSLKRKRLSDISTPKQCSSSIRETLSTPDFNKFCGVLRTSTPKGLQFRENINGYGRNNSAVEISNLDGKSPRRKILGNNSESNIKQNKENEDQKDTTDKMSITESKEKIIKIEYCELGYLKFCNPRKEIETNILMKKNLNDTFYDLSSTFESSFTQEIENSNQINGDSSNTTIVNMNDTSCVIKTEKSNLDDEFNEPDDNMLLNILKEDQVGEVNTSQEIQSNDKTSEICVMHDTKQIKSVSNNSNCDTEADIQNCDNNNVQNIDVEEVNEISNETENYQKSNITSDVKK